MLGIGFVFFESPYASAMECSGCSQSGGQWICASCDGGGAAVCGQNGCETEKGENQSNCCLDCGCEAPQICAGNSMGDPNATCQTLWEICTNDIDDNGDTAVDCDDPDCDNDPACTNSSSSSSPSNSACCKGSSCEMKDIETCVMEGGSYGGESCSPNPCGEESGACCNASNQCSQLTRSLCVEDGGFFAGGQCSDTPSPCGDNSANACCNGSSCSMVEYYACMNGGGTPQGDGTSCDPNPCSPPPPNAPPIAGARCYRAAASPGSWKSILFRRVSSLVHSASSAVFSASIDLPRFNSPRATDTSVVFLRCPAEMDHANPGTGKIAPPVPRIAGHVRLAFAAMDSAIGCLNGVGAETARKRGKCQLEKAERDDALIDDNSLMTRKSLGVIVRCERHVWIRGFCCGKSTSP